MYQFEDYIDNANKAENVDELKNILLSNLSKAGLDSINLVFDTPHPHLGLDAGINIIHTSNFDDFFTYYRDMKFEKVDPVLAYAKINARPFTWDSLFKKITMSKKQANVIHSCKEAGFHHGIYIPISRGNLHAGVALASTCNERDININYDLMSAYCHHFYDVFSRLQTKHPHKVGEFCYLSPKEKEILTLVALGKTDAEIAQILAISTNTVETHLRHCYRKLDANNRTSAVAKALAGKYISINRLKNR